MLSASICIYLLTNPISAPEDTAAEQRVGSVMLALS